MRLHNYINEEKDYKSISYKILSDCKQYFDLVRKENVDNIFLYRGTYKNVKSYKKIKTRKNRIPTDMCKNLQFLLDNYFKKYFGIKARSETVFCSPSEKSISKYGNIYIIIPIGKFDYIWSKNIIDLYSYLTSSYSLEYDTICYDESMVKGKWNESFGKNQNGTWFYDGKNTGKKYQYDVQKAVEDDGENFDKNKLEWVPMISFDEWYKNIKNKAKKDFEEIVKYNYVKNKKFKLLMDVYNNVEVMLNCDYYYLINTNEIHLLNFIKEMV